MSSLFRREDADPGYASGRQRMVERQLRFRGVNDETVLAAMERVPREAFIPPGLRDQAYVDGPLPIGHEQTISQPYVVACMTEALRLQPGQRVLEVGTGSGYQTAILAEMGMEVHTIERIQALAAHARVVLTGLGYENIFYHHGDGHAGWPEAAPYDGILVTAAAEEVPHTLIEQLAEGGRMVLPVGRFSQELQVYRRNEDNSTSHDSLFAVRFVPLLHGTK